MKIKFIIGAGVIFLAGLFIIQLAADLMKSPLYNRLDQRRQQIERSFNDYP